MKIVFNPFTGTFDFVSTETPGGADTNVQFNDGGSFGGDAGFTFNKTDGSIETGGKATIGGTETGQSTFARGLVVNDSGGNTAEDGFRVETSSATDAFEVDAETNEVRIGVDFELGGANPVDTIETTLTDDDTHLPTSGAVVDAISASSYWTEDDGDIYRETGNVGIGTTTPSARLHLAGGTTTNPSLKIADGDLLTTPEIGSVEFANDRFYITNVNTQRAIDRTSDVLLETVDVTDTTTETTLFTAPIPANSARVGNVLKIRSCGKISTASASDTCTIRFKIGGVTVATVDSPGKILSDDCWDIEACSTIRATGTSASAAIRIKMMAEDNTSSYCDVGTFDDTGDLDVTITAEWNNAKTGNSISIGQGWMEYKN